MKLERPPEYTVYEGIVSDFFDKKHEKFLEKSDERYDYWDSLKYKKGLPFPEDLVKSWSLVKFHRMVNYKTLDFSNTQFHYYITANIQKDLHEFDLKLIGGLYQDPITASDKHEYLRGSILEEAIASSQVEGAATTTKVAFEMLKSERSPRNESEQMIFNNLRSIQFITGETGRQLDFEFIVEIHKIMTAKTSAEYCSGGFRTSQIFVTDHVDGEIAHTPPAADKLEGFMQDLCDFANSEKQFIHPIVKASIIHFMFGFIHPFMDGNGRTARALFYWYLLKKDYSLIKNISISRAILNSRIQYDKAFLMAEYDGFDLTYFINYSVRNLRIAFQNLIKYRDKKKEESDKANLIAYKLLNKGLNKRQADLVGYLYHKNNPKVNIGNYSLRHDVVRLTARRDINDLIKKGLVVEEKIGRDVMIHIKSKDAVEAYANK
ncbi:Fic family protein [Flavobacterium sp. MAH-1]|uniref:Fic family protein n=1 Tax=Flavobacterium agri TaxID=2743471 RepID=A0A7Y8Y399_9FLAO|nr:Fic family protein [Flavobacterium agri]NUY81744.1 Fic family protein [Flavobacterium agri]NYA71768.1 Fic family protein [Flavobacterium agri]